MHMAAFDYAQAIEEDQPRSLVESQIKVPSLNIFLGSTPAYSALEAMSQLVYLPEQDRQNDNQDDRHHSDKQVRHD